MSLGDPGLYRRLDPGGMAALITGLPQQCRQAWERALAFPLPGRFAVCDRAVVLGMGGSAIGGDLAGDLQTFDGARPVTVNRQFTLPADVSARTLVVASSYSGDTEETLTAFQDALARGAMAMAITTGGKLASLCQKEDVPLLLLERGGPPRTAVGGSLFSLLAVLQRLGMAPERTAAVGEAIAGMEQMARAIQPSAPETADPAKRLARRVGGRVVVVYGAQYLTAVARRWKTQVNENAKSWAFFEVLPELGHNAIEGLGLPPGAGGNMFVVLLRGSLYHPRVALALDLTAEALDRAGVPRETFAPPGSTALAQIMASVLMGDYLSYYLAMLRGVDPMALPAIQWLKGRMAHP